VACVYSVLSETKLRRLSGRDDNEGWYHLEARSLTCLVVEYGCYLGPLLDHWAKHPERASSCGLVSLAPIMAAAL
jgi:hypothetical protein